LDYSHISKHRNLNVSTALNEVSTWAVNQTGFFCSAPKWRIVNNGLIKPFDERSAERAALLSHHLGVPAFPMEQKGVLRTNCIDCLDRTNVAQFSAGVEALEQQLVVMGIRSSTKLDPSSNIVRMLIDMYVEIGDHIALQYGGSEAHKKVSTDVTTSSVPGPMGKHKELLTSIRRYYSNAFTDRLKQDAMNLFLGYYIPCRHAVPLWDMENDYYLHNYHVRSGRGTLQSIKAYERSFAVDWSDDEEEEEHTGTEKVTTLAPSPIVSCKLVSPQSLTDQSREYENSWRIARVRRRCKAQNDALSTWWRVAIQSYIQQRMWMQLGSNPLEDMVPSRFERIYQPDKLAQFDRFFARAWATPVRLSHAAQHSQSATSDEETKLVVRKAVFAPLLLENEETKTEEKTETNENHLRACLDEHGYDPKITSSLKSFSAHLDDRGIGGDTSAFVGALSNQPKPCDEYLRYTETRPDFRRREKAMEEFKQCLQDTTLNSDDVEGIRRLTRSAHVGNRILSGPYSGLEQSKSGTTVATVIHEQFDALTNMRNRGELLHGFQDVQKELKRRGLDTPGVQESIAQGWKRFEVAEQQYKEVLNTASVGCRRSNLTTAESLKLYSSFFDNSTPLSDVDKIFLFGPKVSNNRNTDNPLPTGGASDEQASAKIKPKKESPARISDFVQKASTLGVNITSHEVISNEVSPALFTVDRNRRVPLGFEQINEDLFARKDNKFMVFNGAGVETWNGTTPVTKIAGIEEDVFVA